MQITAYNCTDDNHHIPKHMTQVDTFTGSVRGDVAIENPYIRIEATSADFNYIYVDEFNRYYHVIDKVYIRTNIMELVCKVDVLQSFYKQFMYCPMICSRSHSTYNPYIVDTKRKFQQDTIHQYVRIGRFSDDFACVLVSVGGAIT